MELEDRHHRIRRPWSFDEVRALFEARGCTLLEDTYAGYRQRMRYRCPSGHEYSQPFRHFVSGHGCPRCRSERRWKDRRINLDDVMLSVEDEGLTDVLVSRTSGLIRLEYTCHCGTRSSTSYQHFVAGQRCRNCAFARNRGPSNPRYNHGLTNEERARKRKYEEYGIWRRAVFERDGYACRRCGTRGRLNAHHVVSYSATKELRIDVNNGITLCVACHRAFHRAHGYRNNNAGQLADFMGSPWV